MATDAVADASTGTTTHRPACWHHAVTKTMRTTHGIRHTRHAHGYGLNDGHDGANAAAALITAFAVILCASGMLTVTAMDAIIIAMLAVVMTSMLRASRDCTYMTQHDNYAVRKAYGKQETSWKSSRAAIDRCCAYCLYILLWAGAAMLYVLSEGSRQDIWPTAVTLSVTLTAFFATLAARRHANDTQCDARQWQARCMHDAM